MSNCNSTKADLGEQRIEEAFLFDKPLTSFESLANIVSFSVSLQSEKTKKLPYIGQL